MKNLVTVMTGSFSTESKCGIKRCRCKSKYLIFGWDGKPMMSRLIAESCSKHLSKTISKVMKEDKGMFKAPSPEKELEYWLNKVNTKRK